MIHATMRFMSVLRHVDDFAGSSPRVPFAHYACTGRSVPRRIKRVVGDIDALAVHAGKPPRDWPTCPRCLVEIDRILDKREPIGVEK